MSTTGQQKSYTVDFKRKVVASLKGELNGNITAASKKFQVDRKRIREWRDKEDQLNSAAASSAFNTKKRRRLENKQTSARNPQLEIDVVEWIRNLRAEGVTVHGNPIRNFAKERARFYGLTSEQFKASRGWLCRFLRRHKLTRRAITSVGQSIPANAPLLAKNFIRDCKNAAQVNSTQYAANMDETPFWFDLPASYSFDFSGVKSVKCKTTGYEKMRFTVVLTACSTGVKLPVMIIFKGLKKVPKGNFPQNSVITVADGGTMTSQLMETWVNKVWKRRPGAIFRTPTLLTMDAHRAHTAVIEPLRKDNNTCVISIPGGMTSLLQPCDVSWNKPMKDAVRAKWQEWLVSGEKEFTASGKRKRASYETVVHWVCDAWDAIDRAVIERSFECTGTTSDDVADLHSTLKKLVEEGVIPTTDIVDTEEDEDVVADTGVAENTGSDTDTGTGSEDNSDMDWEVTGTM